MTVLTREQVETLLELRAKADAGRSNMRDESNLYLLEKRLVRPLAEAYLAGLDAKPIDMVLHCPACGLQHIDAPSECWDNPPHRSHLCHGCGSIWRPADVATNGVEHIKTFGSADTPRLIRTAPAADRARAEELERMREWATKRTSINIYRDSLITELDRRIAAIKERKS